MASDVPGCVILDLEMPGRSGIELQKELASRKIDFPIVFMTGHADVPTTVTAMITVVDDDASVRKALSRLIAAFGYEAAVYESAEAFLAADAITETECLVLDVHLPGMSGLDLQASLIQSGIKCPVVFITAFDEDHPRSEALAGGATEFLRKPIDSDRLITAISKAIDSI